MVVDVEYPDLARLLAEAARDLNAVPGAQATLDEVCRRAVAVVAGCSSAGISEARPDRHVDLLACTDSDAQALHDVQHQLGEGPCVDAIWDQRVVWSQDLGAEQRWPTFAAKAVEAGFRSMVAIQLYTHEHTLGALSLYSRLPDAFDEVTRDVAQVFAAHAAIAIAGARQHTELSEALLTRQQIGQATGILSERYGVTTDQAFTLLIRTSQNHNIKIRDLAARLVTAEDRRRAGRRTAAGTARRAKAPPASGGIPLTADGTRDTAQPRGFGP